VIGLDGSPTSVRSTPSWAIMSDMFRMIHGFYAGVLQANSGTNLIPRLHQSISLLRRPSL
jgi:hypothetical protein